MCFSKWLWESLDGFDEGFFFTGEDADFCLRATKAGYKSIQLPNLDIKHKDGMTINRSEMSYFKYYEGYKSKFRLILKHANILQIITSFILQFAVYMPYRAIVIREKSTIPLLQAFLFNIKKLSSTLSERKNIHEEYNL